MHSMPFKLQELTSVDNNQCLCIFHFRIYLVQTQTKWRQKISLKYQRLIKSNAPQAQKWVKKSFENQIFIPKHL